jgi:prophage regulatory protein
MKVIRLADVLEKTGLARSTVYKLIAEGAFPAPVKLLKRTVAWVEAEVDSWLLEKIAERDKK